MFHILSYNSSYNTNLSVFFKLKHKVKIQVYNAKQSITPLELQQLYRFAKMQK